MITCPECHGHKTGLAIVMTAGKAFEMDCPTCNGTGQVTAEFMLRLHEGRAMRDARIQRGVGLREEAERRGILPSDLCKMENGHLEPVWDKSL